MQRQQLQTFVCQFSVLNALELDNLCHLFNFIADLSVSPVQTSFLVQDDAT